MSARDGNPLWGFTSAFPEVRRVTSKNIKPRTISIFEKLRAPVTSSKFQNLSSKEAPSSKLKDRPARRLPRHLFLGFGVLRFGTSLELGVWCLVFRSAVGLLRCARTTANPKSS